MEIDSTHGSENLLTVQTSVPLPPFTHYLPI